MGASRVLRPEPTHWLLGQAWDVSTSRTRTQDQGDCPKRDPHPRHVLAVSLSLRSRDCQVEKQTLKPVHTASWLHVALAPRLSPGQGQVLWGMLEERNMPL